ncbi:MAG: hypothetical protein IJH37_05885 [Clostridia bacterium]|nr:hypothetical protein [Clostridia bacterium]
MKRISAVITSIAVSAAMSVTVTATNITAKYDKETDNGKVELTGVETTGRSQTMIVLSEDSNSVNYDEIVWLNQKDDGTAFDAFYLPRGIYENLGEGKSATYYVRIGGSNGTIQRTELTISKEVIPTPTPEPTEEPTGEPAPEATPTAEPTATPTVEPTATPTPAPTATPTPQPTATPTPQPTATPTPEPTATPTPAVPDIKCRIDVNEKEAEATAHILNTYDENKSVVIAVTQYDSEGNLISIKSKEIVVSPNPELPGVYTVKADQIAANVDHVRCFIWDGFKTMKPITELKE